MTSASPLDDLASAIVLDHRAARPDGSGPLDDFVQKLRSSPRLLNALREQVRTEAFIKLATHSLDNAVSARHVLLKLQLGDVCDPTALRRAIAKQTNVGLRAQLYFMLRDAGQLPSFAKFSEDKELLEKAPIAWIDLLFSIVPPSQAAQILADTLKIGRLVGEPVFRSLPKLRIAFGAQFVPLLRHVVDAMSAIDSGKAAQTLLRVYGLRLYGDGDGPHEKAASPPRRNLDNVRFLDDAINEKEQRRRIATGS